jgi:hypothetical protein
VGKGKKEASDIPTNTTETLVFALGEAFSSQLALSSVLRVVRKSTMLYYPREANKPILCPPSFKLLQHSDILGSPLHPPVVP